MLGLRLSLLLGLLALFVAGDLRSVPVWRSDTTLWPHAAAVTPYKPRPLINYAKQVFVQGRDADALRLVERAERLETMRGRR